MLSHCLHPPKPDLLPPLLMCSLWLSGAPRAFPSRCPPQRYPWTGVEGRERTGEVGQARSLFEFGHDTDEEDHADEDEADDNKHGPEQPVD